MNGCRLPKPPGLSVLAIAATLAAGCGAVSSTSPAQTSTQSGELGPVGYSALFLQDPAQAAMVRVFEQAAKRTGVKTLTPTSANGDASKQDADIRNLVNQGAKSLLVIPADARAVVPALRYAMGRGVHVASLMLGPVGGKATVSLQVDNKKVGAQACAFLGDKLKGKGTVLQIEGDMRQTTAQDREAGFDSCMKKSHPGIRVITKPGGQWEPAKAAQAAAGALSTNPDLGGIFMASDGYVPSVAQVVKKQGRSVGRDAAGHLWTVSVDGTPAALDAIRKGQLDASASQPVDQFVKYALLYLKRAASGQAITAAPADHDNTMQNSPDGYPVDIITSRLATAENVNDPTLWANLKG